VIGVDAEPPADAPVTTTVTRRIKPGHETAYEQFLAGISGAARAFPG
jgi:antibiotic biosynthesis monooxygenase (ABM) superfamily enzyme